MTPQQPRGWHALVAGALLGLSLSTTALAQDVELYDQPDFRGVRLTLSAATPDLGAYGVGGRVASVVVKRGQWECCTQPQFGGACISVGPGRYGQLPPALRGNLNSLRESGGGNSAASPRPTPPRERLAAGIILCHLAVLISFLTFAQPATWRMVSNGVIWGGLSLASYWCLRRARPVFWRSLVAPANAFLLHGLFHGLRVGLAVLLGGLGWTEASASLQIIGDLEVSFFMVALFVSLLLANLQLRHEELSCAHAEVQTLSGLLPICAWCKKVRDDAGYWQQVEDYFSARSQIEFTHGMCNDCFNVQRVGKPRT